MTPKIMIVDDDVEFIKQAKKFPFKAEIHAFTDPSEALSKLSSIIPDITITDVMMPGVHGFRFMSIARDIIRSLNLIVISANPKEQVERDFGSLGNTKFFRKPLDEDFFEFIIELVKNIASSPVKPPDKTRVTDNGDASSETSSAEIALDQLSRLAEIYKRYHDLMYNMALKNKEFFSDNKHGDEEWEKLERNIDASLTILVGNNPEKKNKVLSNLDREYKSWETRVLESKEKFITPRNIRYEEPVLLQDYMITDICKINVPIHSFKVDWDKSGEPILEINDVQVSRSEMFMIYRSKAGILLVVSKILDALEWGEKHSRTRHIRAFWFTDRGFSGSYSIDGFHLDFKGKALDNFRSSGSFIGNFYLKDEVVNEFDGGHLPPIPPKSIIHGKISIAVEYKNKEISAFHEGKRILIPVDELIAYDQARGFKPDSGPNARAVFAINFIYDIVLRNLSFKYA